MSKLTIVKKFEFGAAHRLPNYDGPCNRLHGHNWTLEIGISGPVGQDSGMIMDFKDLKALVKTEVIDRLDHYYLNDLKIFAFPGSNPTAENMVMWIAKLLVETLKAIDPSLELALVRLWETSSSYCEWRA